VTVLPTHLTGYAWHEGTGWVKLGSDSGGPYANTTAANWGVNLDTLTGTLSGFAWSENAGWIRMDPPFGGVTYDGLTREMSGWAWSEGYGWIHFRSAAPVAYGVGVVPCGTITGTVTGGGAICEGSSTTVTVTVSGGTAPYTVTLDNGGGTQSGAGPAFEFLLGPTATTTYAVAALADAYSCPGTGSGSATVTVHAVPATPEITAPSTLSPGESFTASVPNVPGVSYDWHVTNGTITGGDGTNQLSVTAGTTSPVTITLVESDLVTGCHSEQAETTIPLTPLSATKFYPLTPCRIFDTRNASGSDAAAPTLGPGETRAFAVGTRCGLDTATMRTLSVNVTVAIPAADGELAVWRGDLAAEPVTSAISFRAGRTRANNGFLELSRASDGTIRVHNRSTGAVDFILDVNGVFK
jgi:hypothetical protein